MIAIIKSSSPAESFGDIIFSMALLYMISHTNAIFLQKIKTNENLDVDLCILHNLEPLTRGRDVCIMDVEEKRRDDYARGKKIKMFPEDENAYEAG
jgi:hypothetical protein